MEAASNEQQSSKKHSQEVHRLRAELEEARTKHAQALLDQSVEATREKREIEEKEVRDLRTEFEIKNMELRQLQDKAIAIENENERIHRSLVEAHQKFEKIKTSSEKII